MAFRLGRAFWTSTAAAIAMTSLAGTSYAQTPPPGALFDLATVHPGALTGYTNFVVNFVATQASTTVSFAFREVPAYFAFDNVFVGAAGTSNNLLANASFESGPLGSNFPAGWTRFIQPIDTSAIGQVSSTGSPYGCNVGASSGTTFWCDGSVQGYDGLAQTLTTVIGQTYKISFDLEDDSGSAITYPTIDMLAYAEGGLPGGTVAVPEPSTSALLGVGVLGMIYTTRRLKAGRSA